MIIIALGMLVTVLPLSLLFRHKPEHYGYLPDGQAGDQAELNNCNNLAPKVEVDFKAKQALKSSIFWRIALAFLCDMMILNAVSTHVMPYLSSIGIIRSRSSLIATAMLMMSMTKEQLIDVLSEKLGIERPHKVVVGVNKGKIKAQIRALKKQRDQALESKDRAEVKKIRRNLHRLRHRLRKAVRLT